MPAANYHFLSSIYVRWFFVLSIHSPQASGRQKKIVWPVLGICEAITRYAMRMTFWNDEKIAREADNKEKIKLKTNR